MTQSLDGSAEAELLPRGIASTAKVGDDAAREAQEQQALRDMKEAVVAAGVAIEGVLDRDLLRFLRARAYSIPKASQLFIDDVAWRQQELPIPPSAVEAEMRAGKAFIVAEDGQRSWVFFLAKNHDSHNRVMETFQKFTVFLIDKTVSSLPEGEETFGAVLDLGGTQHRNLDARALVAILAALQAHFPERLYRLYVIHVPYIFWGIWKAVKGLIDPRTRAKIVFVENAHLSKKLAEEMPESMIPKEYGGQKEPKSLWEMCGEN